MDDGSELVQDADVLPSPGFRSEEKGVHAGKGRRSKMAFSRGSAGAYCHRQYQTLGSGTFGKVIQATWHNAPPPGGKDREVALK